MGRSALALVVFAACGGGDDRSAAAKAAPLASAAFYRVDAAPQPACVAGQPCEARLVLSALGSYHLNTQYPFKFIPDEQRGVAVTGASTFAPSDAKTGTLVIPFRVEHAGRAQLRGTFKLSVCADEACEIETPAVAIAVSAS